MSPKKKSIVLITVDCLRADHVGFMGYDRPTTPFLDALSREALVFPAAIVAGAPTYYSLPAFLASRYPLALGRDVLGIAPEETTLPSHLKRAGYSTACFSAANPYISARFGYQQGFDVFNDFLGEDVQPLSSETLSPVSAGWPSRLNRKLQQISSAVDLLRPVYDELYFRYCQRVSPVPASLDALRRFPAADVIVDHACEWLASSSDQPFFLWLHLMDPHSPYYPKEEATSLMGSDPVTSNRARYLNSYWNRSDLGPRRFTQHQADVLDLYDAGIRWADTQVQRLVAALQRMNRWDDCIFALTADHGEEFLDHGGRYHPPSTLMEELIHVPLLLRAPGSYNRTLSGAPFSMIHLAPTLLDAAGLSIPPEFQGRSHWQELNDGSNVDGIAISECVAGCTNPFHLDNRSGPRTLAIRDSRFKMVLTFRPPEERLYDLEKDPKELAPVDLAAHKQVRRKFLEIAREHLQHSLANRDSNLRLHARLRQLRLELENPSGKSLPVAS
jgi:arylsulfatase A-like enzyme